MPRQKQPNKQKTSITSNNQGGLRNGADLYNTENGMTPVLENLEVLHLG